MFRGPRLSGATLRKSPKSADHEESRIQSFQTLDVEVFNNVQEFFRQLGMPFQTDNDKRTIHFNLAIEEKLYMENIQKLTWGVIAFDTDGNKMTVNRVDAAKFNTLAVKDFPTFAPFKSQLPACSVTQHPAFIKDYSAMHTNIMERWTAGTYAIMNEEDNHYLLVYVDGSSSRNVARGLRFNENEDGSIQLGSQRFNSIHDFLHDGQYVITGFHRYQLEKHPLNRTLADVIEKNQDLEYEVAAYVQTRKNPEILRIVDFLKNLSESTRRSEEDQLISAAINQLYLTPACVSDILECLTRALPAAASGVINAPLVTTLGVDNDAKYYRNILLKGAHDSTQSVDDLMKQLTEIYAERSNYVPERNLLMM